MSNESSHWYDREGNSVFELPKKDGSGLKKTTLADARKMDLLPSVTTLFKVLAKPELDDWKAKQITTAAASNPIMQGEDIGAYHKRITDIAFAQVDEAADLGTRIHKAIEQHFQGIAYDVEMSTYVDSVQLWVRKTGIKIIAQELRLVNLEEGYAGTTDCEFSVDTQLFGETIGILDFKSRKTKTGEKVTPRDTEPAQIAAYYVARYGTIDGAYGCNVYISTTEPGRIEATWYNEADLKQAWELFRHCAAIWRIKNKYDPRKMYA